MRKLMDVGLINSLGWVEKNGLEAGLLQLIKII
jgi:hypothetical protein